MKFSIKDADLVTFTEEIVNGKLHFLCNVSLFSLSYFQIRYPLFTTKKFRILVYMKVSVEMRV